MKTALQQFMQWHFRQAERLDWLVGFELGIGAVAALLLLRWTF